MTDISTECGLSKKFTNHSIRVTDITVLMRLRFSASEIMLVTSHKSVQSLINYQNSQPSQMKSMGKVLYQSMTCEEDQIQRPQLQLESVQNVKQIHLPQSQLAIMATTPCNIKQHKENITPSNALVPFEAKFSQSKST